MMQTHSFELILGDADDVVDDITQACFLVMCDALFEAGCDDGSPGVFQEVVSIHFDREADTLRKAIESAIADVERAGYRVAKVEPDDRQVFDQINEELTSRTPA